MRRSCRIELSLLASACALPGWMPDESRAAGSAEDGRPVVLVDHQFERVSPFGVDAMGDHESRRLCPPPGAAPVAPWLRVEACTPVAMPEATFEPPADEADGASFIFVRALPARGPWASPSRPFAIGGVVPRIPERRPVRPSRGV